MLAGTRYPFRISSGQTPDGNGTRVHLNIDPGERALAADLEGVLAFEAQAPRFEGAVSLAMPAGQKDARAASPGVSQRGSRPITPAHGSIRSRSTMVPRSAR